MQSPAGRARRSVHAQGREESLLRCPGCRHVHLQLRLHGQPYQGNDAGVLHGGRARLGDTPAGIKKVFHSETQFGLVGYRTQLFGPRDMPNVVKIQAGYKAQTLSQFLKQPAPPAAPPIDFPSFTKDDMKRVALPQVPEFCPAVLSAR